MKTPVAERFWPKVKITDGCWEWTGCTNVKGYGILGTNETGETLAHRISWVLSGGVIPEGKWVLHQCDNPKCVRPEHLFIGDHKENMRDAAFKGRMNLGENNPGAVLTWGQIDDIRLKHYEFVKGLAKEYGVGRRYLWDEVLMSKRWLHRGSK